MKRPLAGGESTTIASGLNSTYGVAVDATHVYWTNMGDSEATNGQVWRASHADNVPC